MLFILLVFQTKRANNRYMKRIFVIVGVELNDFEEAVRAIYEELEQ